MPIEQATRSGTIGDAPERSLNLGTTALRPFDILFAAAFLLFFFLQLAHHNMWRDELNVYGISAASPALPSLFHHIRYEGHPWLWYVLVWATTKIVPSALALKVVEAVVGTLIYLQIWFRSPFSRTEKILISLGYFVSFEYTVMSRMYSLILLLALVYARERSLHPGRVLRLGLVLGLMASTDVLGMILSAALAVEYAYSTLFAERQRKLAAPGPLLLGASVYVVLGLLAVLSARPMPDIDWRTTGHMFSYAADWHHLLTVMVQYIVLPYFPVAFGLHVGPFWNPQPNQHPVFFIACLPLVLLTYLWIFRRHRNLLVLVGTAVLLAVAFGHLIYLGWIRHSGITFMAFFVALWLLRSVRSRLPGPAIALLCLTAMAGLFAGLKEWRRPFSNAEPAAAWLHAQHLDSGPIVGVPDATVASLAELLRRPVYMLDCSCSDTFLLFSNRRSAFADAQVPDRLAIARRDLGTGNFLYISGWPVGGFEGREIEKRGLTLKQLVQFTKAETFGEDYYIYQASASQTPVAAGSIR